MKNVNGQEIGVDKRIDEAVEKSGLCGGLTVCIEYAKGDNSDNPEVDPMVWRIYGKTPQPRGRERLCVIIAELETDAELLEYLKAKAKG
jgi:hypothetical protein